MKEVVEIGDGWKGLEIPGVGVVIKAGASLLLVENTRIDKDELVADFPTVVTTSGSAPQKPQASSIASVNVRDFLEEVKRRNLSTAGEYGPLGPMVAKLRDVLKDIDEDSPVATAFGDLLAQGDHARFGTVAAIIAMTAKQAEEFGTVLANPLPDLVQEFVDRMITGQAA